MPERTNPFARLCIYVIEDYKHIKNFYWQQKMRNLVNKSLDLVPKKRKAHFTVYNVVVINKELKPCLHSMSFVNLIL